ncbi:MAG: hypothetical protein ABII25_00395 [bacterium]
MKQNKRCKESRVCNCNKEAKESVCCPNGHLLAKGKADGIEIKCHRCKHIVLVPASLLNKAALFNLAG